MAFYTGGYATTYDLNAEDLPASLSDVARVSAAEGLRSGLTGIGWRQAQDAINKRRINPVGDDFSGLEETGNPFADNANFLQKRRTRLTKADAEQRAQGLGLTIPDGGISEPYLNSLIERTQDRFAREKVLRTAPQGFQSGTVQLLSNFAGSMADPTNIALSFVPVVSAARTEAMLAKAGGMAGRVGVRAGVGAVEGAVGQAIIEPLTALDKASNQEQYGLGDAITNIAMGAGFGTAAHVGFHAIGRTFGARDRFKGRAVEIADAVAPETSEAVVRAIVAADANGKVIDIAPILDIDPRAAAIKTLQEAGFNTEKTWYHGTPGNTEIARFDLEHVGQNTGTTERAVFFTDSPEAAAAYAYRETVTMSDAGVKTDVSHGSVVPVHLREGKVLDASGMVQKYDRETFDAVIAMARREGFDAVDFGRIVDVPGQTPYGTPESHVIAVLNPDNITSKTDFVNEAKRFDPNAAVSADMNKVRQSVEQSMLPEADRYAEQPVIEEHDLEAADIMQHADELAAQVREIEQAMGVPSSALAEADAEMARAKSYAQAVRAAAICGIS